MTLTPYGNSFSSPRLGWRLETGEWQSSNRDNENIEQEAKVSFVSFSIALFFFVQLHLKFCVTFLSRVSLPCCLALCVVSIHRSIIPAQRNEPQIFNIFYPLSHWNSVQFYIQQTPNNRRFVDPT